MTLKEKVKLTSGQNNWEFLKSDQVDGKSIRVADGPHGVRVNNADFTGSDLGEEDKMAKATLFPSASAMASTWHPELLQKVGKTIGKECRYYGIDVLLGPGINLKRSPLGGRNFEYYSEDPYLTSQMASAFVNGVQSEHVGACIKHFALNEQETMRRFVNSDIDERTFHELYLYPFMKVIKAAHPWMVMSSYNKINGDYASESTHLLIDILRDQWQYDGAVVSDWGAVQNKVKSIKNGMNIEMPGPSSFDEEVFHALENGDLTEEAIDQSLAPLFSLQEKSSLKEPLDAVDFDAHHEVAQAVAKEAIVLLENDGTLPLKDTTIQLGVIGEFADKPRVNGGGSATVRPYHQETPLTALKNTFSNVRYAKGYDDLSTNETLIKDVKEVVRKSDVILYFTGTTSTIETEGKDRDNLNLPEGHLAVFEQLVHHDKPVIVILSNGSALDLRHVANESQALLETWFLGSAAGQPIVDVLTGKTNPSGKLQETFPLEVEHTPHYGVFPQLETVDYSKDLIMNGYRYYDTHHYDVLYPFGYGLSYSTFTYHNIKLSHDVLFEKTSLTVSLDIKNTSEYDGYNTVQIYISDQSSEIVKPVHQLKAFKKGFIKANDTLTVTITVPYDAFESYSVKAHQFVVYQGEYMVKIAQSSKDILASYPVTVESNHHFAPKMDIHYPFHFFKVYYPKWANHIESVFRPLHWYEQEEPLLRIIKRYQRHNDIDDNTINALIKSIKEDLDV
ncbi:MAG: glycoside hydrolase family 3 C-terminal domain-containing protein [Candidatus Izemoplasma sp.]|nr:glycoside hydrolase family 3 C-terminal domain-containing protein [Candidatus Izemoplasma sp.]